MLKIVFLLFILFTFNVSWAGEMSSCLDALRFDDQPKKDFSSFRLVKKSDWLWKVDYFEFPYRKETRLELIDDHWRDSDDLILTFGDNGHTTLFFRGYRIDSNGIIGIQVTSGLHPQSHFFSGKVAFVIKDLNLEAIESLEKLLENFKRKRDVTCIRLTCRYLKSIDPNRFGKLTYFPSHLLAEMVRLQKHNPDNIEIFVRSDVESISHLHFDWELDKSGQLFFFSLLTTTFGASSFAGGFYLGSFLGF